MSSAVVSTSAAQSRLFIFDDESPSEVSCPRKPPYENQNPHPEFRQSLSKRSLPSSDPRLAYITSASHLAIRPAPEMIPSGIAALDTLTGGLPRGCITEICGPVSSGRTSVLLAALSTATRRGECCALIDASDALDPHSATAAAVDLDRLLWIRCQGISPRRYRDTEKKISEEPLTQLQPSSSVILSAAKDPLQVRAGSGLSRNFHHPCRAGSELGRTNRHFAGENWNSRIQSGARQSEHRLEQVLRATDLLLESGGFGLIALDLADVPPESARRIPLTTWFRFRRAIENTPTILLVIEPQPIAGSCSSLVLQLGVPGTQHPVPSSKPSHSHLLTGLEITVELIRSRHDRKPARSVAFETRTAWAG
jgi:recombination protein RecA